MSSYDSRTPILRKTDPLCLQMHAAGKTLAEIAYAAGISVTTVSRTLNAHGFAAVDNRNDATALRFLTRSDPPIVALHQAGKTLVEIANTIGISVSTARRALWRNGITASHRVKPLLDAATLRHYYLELGLSAQQVGDLVGRSANTVCYALSRNEIPIRPPSMPRAQAVAECVAERAVSRVAQEVADRVYQLPIGSLVAIPPAVVAAPDDRPHALDGIPPVAVDAGGRVNNLPVGSTFALPPAVWEAIDNVLPERPAEAKSPKAASLAYRCLQLHDDGMTLVQIAATLRISVSVARRNLRENGVAAGNRIARVFDPVRLRHDYIELGLSMKAIGRANCCSSHAVRNALHKYGIPIRPPLPLKRPTIVAPAVAEAVARHLDKGPDGREPATAALMYDGTEAGAAAISAMLGSAYVERSPDRLLCSLEGGSVAFIRRGDWVIRDQSGRVHGLAAVGGGEPATPPTVFDGTLAAAAAIAATLDPTKVDWSPARLLCWLANGRVLHLDVGARLRRGHDGDVYVVPPAGADEGWMAREAAAARGDDDPARPRPADRPPTIAVAASESSVLLVAAGYA